VISKLAAEQQAALKQALELSQQYKANPSTAVIWQHLIDLVKSKGSLAAMLQTVTCPLLHQYALAPFHST
jgi:hypothetical protein